MKTALLNKAISEAKIRFAHTGEVQRVFRAYGLPHIRPAWCEFYGETVCFVAFGVYEDCALTRTFEVA